jgi:class 3 adenylate cyclase
VFVFRQQDLRDQYLTPVGYLPGGLLRLRDPSLASGTRLALHRDSDRPVHAALGLPRLAPRGPASSSPSGGRSPARSRGFGGAALAWQAKCGRLRHPLPLARARRRPRLAGLLHLVDGYVRERRAREVESVFGKCVGPEVLDFLLADPAATRMGGVERDATPLPRHRGLHPLRRTRKPAEVLALLNAYYAFMVDIILRQRGIVLAFLGDAIFAVFGAPVDDRDHPARAVRAALEIRDAVARFHAGRAEEERLHVRLGVHTGIVVAGNLGAERQKEFTCIGDAVNTAARIQSVAEVGQVYVSDDTDAGGAAATRFAFTLAGEFELKGKSKRVRCHRVAQGRQESVSA